MVECTEALGSFLGPWVPGWIGSWLYVDSWIWTLVGFTGATVFGLRFVLQWLTSESRKALVVPWYFWHFSFWGSLLNFFYALHLDKAPLIYGSFLLPILYGRNLVLLHRGGRRDLGADESR